MARRGLEHVEEGLEAVENREVRHEHELIALHSAWLTCDVNYDCHQHYGKSGHCYLGEFLYAAGYAAHNYHYIEQHEQRVKAHHAGHIGYP